MQRKNSRVIFAVIGLLLIVFILVAIKFKQISMLIGLGKQMEKSGPPPVTVSTATSTLDSWDDSISAVGSVTAVRGVSVSNDAPGVVKKISFESGTSVKEGQVLVELDTSVERAQLASAASKQMLAKSNAERGRKLFQIQAISQSELDEIEATLRNAETEIASVGAQLARKVVKAPFSGRLGIREINIGQYLAPGTRITVLESVGALHIDFSVPQQRLKDISVGMPVHVTVGDAQTDAGPAQDFYDGTVTAIDPVVDEATRAVRLQASVPDEKVRLRTGMFVNVSIQLGKKLEVISVPSTSVIRASFGNSIFLVEDKKGEEGQVATGPDGKPAKVVRQQFVRTGASRGDFISIAEGLEANKEIVSAGGFKLHNGTPIIVNNAVGPVPSSRPQVENR